MKSNPWLVRQAQAQADHRLFCFSYAGGSAANYRVWQSDLAPAIEVCAVQLPGRGARFGEPLVTSMPELVQAIASAIAQLDDGMPFSFFGHSLGSLLAFEVARDCSKHGRTMPRHLFAAGCAAPQARGPSRQLHLLNDEDLVEALDNYSGTSPAVLADPELMQLVLPMIRADFALAETYTCSAAPSLDVPITVLSGMQDAYVSPAQVDAWQDQTTQTCRVEWFDGGHFFVEPHRKAVLDIVRANLISQPAYS